MGKFAIYFLVIIHNTFYRIYVMNIHGGLLKQPWIYYLSVILLLNKIKPPQSQEAQL